MRKTIAKIMTSILCAAALLAPCLLTANAAYPDGFFTDAFLKDVRVVKADVSFNGSFLRFDRPVYLCVGSERLIVPLRPVLEAVGVRAEDISWDGDFGTLTVVHRSGVFLTLYAGANHAFAGTERVRLDTPVRVIGGWVYMPLRFVCESLGAEVYWHEDDNWVEIVME